MLPLYERDNTGLSLHAQPFTYLTLSQVAICNIHTSNPKRLVRIHLCKPNIVANPHANPAWVQVLSLVTFYNVAPELGLS